MLIYIPLPADGSEQCRKAIDGVLESTRTTDRRLIAYTYIEEFPSMAYPAGVGGYSRAYYMETVQGRTKEYIERIAECAREEGVQSDNDVPQFAEPYLGILDMAKWHACDATLMVSYGYRGLMGRLLTSDETCKALTYADASAIIYR